MNSIKTHWSFENQVVSQYIQAQVEQYIVTTRKNVWYKRLRFYFFEQEIRQEVKRRFHASSSRSSYFKDPEYQALMARSARVGPHDYESRDELTLVLNDYIFGQGEFLGLDYGLADEKIIEYMLGALVQASCPSFLKNKSIGISDVVFELRRARADVLVVSHLQEGRHDYHSLLRWCSEYVGTFACLPRFVACYSAAWSPEVIIKAIEQPQECEVILEASYTLDCSLLDAQDIIPYGCHHIEKSPYANRFSQGGRRWALSPWYVKIAISIAIVVVSGYFGGISLMVLPLIWGLVAVARSQWHYLATFQSFLARRYKDYQLQHRSFVDLSNTMMDPAQTTQASVQAQELLSRRYDNSPFSGQELIRNATEYAKSLYSGLMSFDTSEVTQRRCAQMQAVTQWGKEHSLSLLIVQEEKFSEQTLYRFESLLEQVSSLCETSELYQQEFQEQTQSIDEFVTTKKYAFWWWTIRKGLAEGFVVALSSGFVGWMGSYLRNRSSAPPGALAASPHLLVPQVIDSEHLLVSDQVIETMAGVISEEHIEKLLQVLQTKPAGTLWDTMVQTFGYHDGNVYTNSLMDMWWRISADHSHSILFEQSLQDSFPVSHLDQGREELVSFLRRIYDYDNLQSYRDILTDESWISGVLSDLKTGVMHADEFARLPLEQREIVTQALFYHLDPDALAKLFAHVSISESVIPSPGLTGSLDGNIPGSVVQNTGDILTGGDKIMWWQQWWQSLLGGSGENLNSGASSSGSIVSGSADVVSSGNSVEGPIDHIRNGLGTVPPFTAPIVLKDSSYKSETGVLQP